MVGPKFEDAEPLSSGLSRIREGDSYGYADKTGSIVVLPQWASADDFNEELAVVGNLEGPVWYIDRSGNPAFPGRFAVASFLQRAGARQVTAERCQRSQGLVCLH